MYVLKFFPQAVNKSTTYSRKVYSNQIIFLNVCVSFFYMGS